MEEKLLDHGDAVVGKIVQGFDALQLVLLGVIVILLLFIYKLWNMVMRHYDETITFQRQNSRRLVDELKKNQVSQLRYLMEIREFLRDLSKPR